MSVDKNKHTSIACSPLAVPQGFYCPIAIYDCGFLVLPPLSPSSPSGFGSHRCLLCSLFSSQIPKLWIWAAGSTPSHPSTGQRIGLDWLSDMQMSCTTPSSIKGEVETARGRQTPFTRITDGRSPKHHLEESFCLVLKFEPRNIVYCQICPRVGKGER